MMLTQIQSGYFRLGIPRASRYDAILYMSRDKATGLKVNNAFILYSLLKQG